MSNIATAVSIRKNVVDTWNYHIDFTKYAGGEGDRGMQMQVVTYLFQYSERTGEQNTPEYYFYLIHQCVFAPQNLWIDNHADAKGWYVRKYVVDAVITDQSGTPLDYNKATLIASDPVTTEGEVNYQKGVSTTISGSAGFFGDAPTGSVGGSYTVSDSKSFSVKDVTIENKSLGDAGHPNTKWVFQLKPSKLHGSNNLQAPARLGYDTFQPALYQLWKVPHHIKTNMWLHLNVEADIQYASRSSGFLGTSHQSHHHGAYQTNGRYVQLPFPKDPK